MHKRQNILVSMPTGSHSERLKLEGVLQYAHEKSGATWDLELDVSGIAGRIALGSRSAAKYDGIIYYVLSDAERRALLALGKPIVLIEDLMTPRTLTRRKNAVTILCDHEAEGRTAARYFFGRGYRSFAYVGAEKDADGNLAEYSDARRRGFVAEIAAAGLKVGIPPEGSLASWLKKAAKPCAVFAVHDFVARKAIAAAESANLSVPEDVAVLGVDDDEVLCTTSRPTLSSIPTFDRSLGYAAGRALNELFRGQAGGRVLRTRHTKVVTRASTEKGAVADVFVAKALDWARANLDRKLDAGTLARAAGCSKRYLQVHVELELGSTLGAVVRRMRLAKAEELLASTDSSVAEIAEACGFVCVSYLSARMKEAHGLTPLAYRRRCRASVSSD